MPPGRLYFAPGREPLQNAPDYEINLARATVVLFQPPDSYRPDVIVAISAVLIAIRLLHSALCPLVSNGLNECIKAIFVTLLVYGTEGYQQVGPLSQQRL